MKISTQTNQNGTPVRFISGGRELRNYQGYWYIILTPRELEQWPGIHWNGYVLYHKWKVWKQYSVWYGQEQARYYYLDGDRDNIRLTNIGIRDVQTGQWI